MSADSYAINRDKLTVPGSEHAAAGRHADDAVVDRDHDRIGSCWPITQAPAASRTTKRHHPAEPSIQMLDRAADLPQVFRIGRLSGQRVSCTRQHDENQLCHDKSPQYEDIWRRAGSKHFDDSNVKGLTSGSLICRSTLTLRQYKMALS